MSSSPADLFGPPKGWLTDIYRKRFTFMVVVAHGERFRKDFLSWLSLNYAVWIRFEFEANRIWGRGFRHHGARTIWEWLRHETAVREGPNEAGWKLNNNYCPDCARLYILLHPERDGLFEFRVNPLSVRGA